MNHNIETASFSSQEEQTDLLFVPTTDMLSQYNREYSMIVREVQKFLKQTTICIQRFVAYHNYGVNLNLPQLLGNLLTIETSFKDRLNTHNQELSQKMASKHKYEASFNRLILRMTDLFNDLIDCELQFKKNYFGVKSQEKTRQVQQRLRTSRSPVAYSVSSMTKSSNSEKHKLQSYLQNEEREEKREAELRATLNQRLKPKASVLQTECKHEYSTTQNLYRLNEKIDTFISDIKATRSREQKLIQLFNLNRIKKIHTPLEQPTQCFTPSNISVISPKDEENEGEQMDSILESWRQVRKNSDSYTEKSFNGKRFFKKRTSTNINQN